MPLLTDLADACRKSGLRVIELDGWKTNWSAGDENYQGVLCHHTGSYDSLTDADNDHDYARWMAFQGRDDLDPPLCNLALSAEGVVYVCASGNANHAGKAKASGPMPAATDGNAIYIGIEAMNSGSQGWDSTGTDAHGNPVTQYQAYVRLCRALCEHYDWPASHVRAHKETSETGKWDPGLLDMDRFRFDIANATPEDIMASKEELAELLDRKIGPVERQSKKNGRLTYNRDQKIMEAVAALADAVADTATKAQVRRLAKEVAALSDDQEGA